MNRFHLLASVGIALALAGSAAAQIGPPGPKGHGPMGFGPGGFALLEFDANADGKLTKAEFDAALKTRFGEIDGNKDGTATREEMKASMEARRAKMEAAHFAKLDTDKNGQLSLVEFRAAHDGKGPGGPGGFGRHSGGPKGHGGPDGRPDHDRGPQADRAGPGPAAGKPGDKDAGLTFAEFSKRPLEAFARADTNKDGMVTIAELQAQPPGPPR